MQLLIAEITFDNMSKRNLSVLCLQAVFHTYGTCSKWKIIKLTASDGNEFKKNYHKDSHFYLV